MLAFILIVLMCLFYIMNEFLSFSIINSIYLILTAGVFILMWVRLTGLTKVFTMILLVAGMMIHIYTGDFIIEGLTQNVPLLALLLLAPLLSVPLRREGLLEGAISHLEQYQHHPRYLFYGISSMTAVVSPVLNMGAIRIVNGLIAHIKASPQVLSRSYFVGLTPAMIWSPFLAPVGIVLFYLDLQYLSFMPLAVTFAFLQLVIGLLLFRPAGKFQKDDSMTAFSRKERLDLIKILVFVLMILGILLVSEQLLDESMLLLVSLISLIVPGIWFVLRATKKIFKEEMSTFQNRLQHQSKNEICLFLSAGVFGNAVAGTGVRTLLEDAMIYASEFSLIFLFLFFVLCVSICAFLGIHQVITVPLLITAFLSTGSDVDPLLFAFICVFTWMVASALSPLNALNIIVSTSVERSGMTVAYKYNGVYFLVMIVLAGGFLMLF
ncbi:hypothetical protein [Jeotgalibacillus aurantiacus]|uniref:hypothetical protein n=1 Tax=Jeotgalibacillus aurantiacus TaxID=2763266 RepID=UPI001D0B13BC|nr:hypothetical protein [Jeotgalibacillus aurantiacus]